MEAALIEFRPEVDHCLGASNLSRSTIRFAVNSRLGIFMSFLYKAGCANVMFLRGGNDCMSDSVRAAVHGQLLRLRNSVDALQC